MTDDPVFPPELFAIIINALAGDLETLRSCALVSSTFYGLARVFSHLQVGPLVDQEHNFAQLSRVESLRLCVKWRETNPPSWIIEADLGRCLPLLVTLTRLCITVEGSYTHWLSLPNRHSIQAILPTLTCLELHKLSELPLTLLACCLSLRSLTLDDVAFADGSAAAAADSCSSIQLEHLVLRALAVDLAQFVDWVVNPDSPFDISCLRSLECTGKDFWNRSPIQRLLNASPSLQRLSMKNYCFSAHKIYEFDLRVLVHLRTLTLDIFLDDSEADNDQRLLSLANFVFPPPQQAQIALVLDIMTHDEPRRANILQHLADADHIVCRLPFETVTVILARGHPEHGREEKLVDVRDEFVRAMPLLASKPGRTDRLCILESIPVQ
ncbi:hypothetical protein C8R45DRAFT_1073100 [Mycena sanguinolenta]|nr:hypothetical protein C8R45DRAFT_1073100 [Mycena sanguinolenta]